MIVLDASAMVEALVGAAPSDELLGLLEGDLHAPHLLDVEVMSVLRGLELGRAIPPARAEQALDDYWSFGIERYDLEPLGGRIWELRHQFTSYDASYLALAEALRAPVVTCDRKLRTGGHRADIRLMSGTT
ncbi:MULTISPECIES: type II toxin-antitoxin system VapC family toxin [unclassified Luteococcus]|uniref:type II toxin-antitoxin system VapC family toxin n=1 Tax=unclassified Luteococcus TaxID=2639923 RepID=UPI00313D3AA1